MQQLYQNSGFFWNHFLRDFVAEYGSRVVKYRHFKTSDFVTARFCLPSLIAVGRDYGQHVLAASYMGEEIAPVGECSDGSIELLLTQSGRLVGFADYMMLYWGDLEPGNWKQSVQWLLGGSEPLELGVIE